MERHPLHLPICDQEPINSPTPTPPRNTSTLPPTTEPNDNEPTHTVELLAITNLEPRHSERLKKPPARLANYVCNMASAQSSSLSPGMQYPISNFLCSNPYSNNHLHFINSIIKHIEPTSSVSMIVAIVNSLKSNTNHKSKYNDNNYWYPN